MRRSPWKRFDSGSPTYEVSVSDLELTRVEVSASFAASSDALWSVVGDFGALHRWHPWVPACVLSADGQTRVLRAGEEVVAVERLLEQTERSHTYTVDQGPFPMTAYRATLCVTEMAEGCRLHYRGECVADGAPERVAAQLRRFFEVGFSALAVQFDGGDAP